jgi:hypothetical protein
MLDLSSWRYSLKKLPHEIGTLSELKESWIFARNRRAVTSESLESSRLSKNVERLHSFSSLLFDWFCPSHGQQFDSRDSAVPSRWFQYNLGY